MALVVLLAILLGAVKLFLYFASSLSSRQATFEQTRTIENNVTLGADPGICTTDVQGWSDINVPAPDLQ